ncbi:hypothetical protein GTY65_03080 [Streptomyces sp. SID8379]|uniref:hypothetical protein n=1 Tax=unclassified Streptomyces TaxID=2593676 RepID=UPI00037AD384|nr:MULTISPECIES: hypothetical protein [unclassified Streptomyces]MYW63066.1 hypothetical protein [Streptomyces sp. SID8379]
MDDDIQLISDGDGLAVIGSHAAVERFLVSEGLPSKDLGLARLGSALGAGATATRTGAEVAAASGRWVKLTEQSAQAMKKHSLMKGSHEGAGRAVLTENGKIKGLLEVVRTPRSFLTNPAVLAGAAGLMAQLAMQQTMDEITDYLAAIDEKVDDILSAQKDAVLADMIGAGLVIEEALTVREQVGRVSEVTWSKVQNTATTIARTQAYAMRQLEGLADKLEQKTKVADLAKAAKEAELAVREWLAVLARCLQLHDAIAVLELDRVLDASPQELDQHRLGLRAARQNRMELISRSTERLMIRMDAAVGTANTKVLLHPTASPAVVRSSNRIAVDVVDFHGRLGIERDRQSADARRWADAVAQARDKALGTGADGVHAARRLGNETFDRARSVTGRIAGGMTERVRRRRGGDERREDDPGRPRDHRVDDDRGDKEGTGED